MKADSMKQIGDILRDWLKLDATMAGLLRTEIEDAIAACSHRLPIAEGDPDAYLEVLDADLLRAEVKRIFQWG